MKKITAREVGRKAGVSVGGVSRILNNLSGHAPATVARVGVNELPDCITRQQVEGVLVRDGVLPDGFVENNYPELDRGS